jgi:hypothetical protein
MLSLLLTAKDERKLRRALPQVRARKLRRRLQGLLLMCEQLPVKTAARQVGISYRELNRVAQRYLAQRSLTALRNETKKTARQHVELTRATLAAILKLDARRYGHHRRCWSAAALSDYLRDVKQLQIPVHSVSEHLSAAGFRYNARNVSWELTPAAQAAEARATPGPPLDWQRRLARVRIPARLTRARGTLWPTFTELQRQPRRTPLARLLAPWKTRLYRRHRRPRRRVALFTVRSLALLFWFEVCPEGLYPQQVEKVARQFFPLRNASVRCIALERAGFLQAQRRGASHGYFAQRKFYRLTPAGEELLALVRALLELRSA